MKDFHAQEKTRARACVNIHEEGDASAIHIGFRCVAGGALAPSECRINNRSGDVSIDATKIVCDEASSSIVLEAHVEAAFLREHARASERSAIAS